MQEVRRNKIMDILKEYKSATVSDLASNLNVSEMTIHRDLDMLQKAGLLIKKRGGALLEEARTINEDTDYSYNIFQNLYIKEKNAIAKEALKLISDRETLIFDNSTSAFAVAKILDGFNQLTAIATNPGVFNVLMNSSKITLYSTGGLYSPQSNSFIGSVPEDFTVKMKISTCIIGAMGVSLEYGVTDPFPSEAVLKRKIITSADRVVLLVDHMKLNKISTEKVADIKNIDFIITDWKADKKIIKELSQKTNVIVASEQK